MVTQSKLEKLIKSRGKTVAFSPAGKAVARVVMAAPEGLELRRVLRLGGVEDHVRRIASASLPPGMYYAKLTIRQWKAYEGKQFRLLMGDEVVYGNEVEAPASDHPLEYRNIIVSSKDAANFSLDIDVPYRLAISRGSFTTPQQREYDLKYNVVQHGDVFYSLRGNKVNPKKIFITFPGFGPSTARVSYAVSNMKDITEADLSNTLMICFQDRYLAAGSYMMVDNSGVPLFDRVHQTIEKFRARFGVDQSEILLFGASKGGSIALHYAQGFPQAQLLLAVPQMDLPYYFNKPFFKNNLFMNPVLRSLEQPKDLLQKYFKEGRRIDYFYTNDDELSNQSNIEFAADVPNLTKYRVAGPHGAVARAALPAMLGIIRQFLKGPESGTFDCEEVRTFKHGPELQVQVRLDEEASAVKGANWFLEGRLGRTRFMQIMSEHNYDFVKYTSPDQQIYAESDLLEEVTGLVAIGADGRQWQCQLPTSVSRIDTVGTVPGVVSEPLDLNSETVKDYAILDGRTLGKFRYSSQAVSSAGTVVEVHFVRDLQNASETAPGMERDQDTSHVLRVQSLDGGLLAHLLALRAVIGAGAERLVVVVNEGAVGMKDCEALVRVDWPDVTVNFVGEDPDFRDVALSLRSWNTPERVVIAAAAASS